LFAVIFASLRFSLFYSFGDTNDVSFSQAQRAHCGISDIRQNSFIDLVLFERRSISCAIIEIASSGEEEVEPIDFGGLLG
jgi:hypothetical protein